MWGDYVVVLPLYITHVFSKKSKPIEEMKEAVVSEKQADMKAQAEQQPLLKPSTQPIQPQTAIPLQEVTIENELLKMVWSNEGAALKSIKLKQFKDAEAKDILELLKDTYTEYHPLAIDTFAQKRIFRDSDIISLNKALTRLYLPQNWRRESLLSKQSICLLINTI